MIKFFRLSKQGGAFKKGFENLFSERASWRDGRLQNQMSSGHLVKIAVYGLKNTYIKKYDKIF